MTTISNTELVTLAVYLLGGESKAIDTEDVAIKVHEMAPGRFSWRKYPERINLELVRVRLSEAKNPKKEGLLIGTGPTGWRLSQAGLSWAQEAAKQLDSFGLARPREESKAGSIDENRWRRERARIFSTEAWHRWQSGQTEISTDEICEIFRIDSYATGGMRETKIVRLKALFGEDDEILSFLNHVADQL